MFKMCVCICSRLKSALCFYSTFTSLKLRIIFEKNLKVGGQCTERCGVNTVKTLKFENVGVHDPISFYGGDDKRLKNGMCGGGVDILRSGRII